MKKELTVNGMTCTGCEKRIAATLLKNKGIKKAQVSFRSSSLTLEYDENQIDLETIIAAIEQLGYQAEMSPEGSRNIKISHLLGIIFILMALYLMFKNNAVLNFIPQIDQSMSYGILFVVGLLTSLHCIAMCGGINLSQCVPIEMENDGTMKKYSSFKPSLMYNTGRVISYTLIGGMVGALGSVITFSGAAKGIVAVIAGIFMILMGLNMLDLIPALKKFIPSLPVVFGNKIDNNKGRRPFWVGILNGFMPCGPLQAMQLYALAAGSFWAGASSMLVFSLGTVPLMFGFGAVSTFLNQKYTRQILKISAVLIVFLGIIMLNRGFALSGINVLAAAPSPNSSAVSTARIEGNVQMVTTTLDDGSYKPIIVQKNIPVKWTIKAEASGLNGCNNPVTIPKYNLQKELVPGDNLIEFTPQETGNITYTCWMGMVSSNIKVVDDLNKVTAEDLKINNTNASSVSGSGCCSAKPRAGQTSGTAKSAPSCCQP